jgi:hypothetical protein
MAPSHAEVARTLLQGQIPAKLRLAGQAVWRPVVHATDCCGHVLMLVDDDSELAVALHSHDRAWAPAAVCAWDVPPLAGAPLRGRAGIAGRIVELGGVALRWALADFARVKPLPGLLDVGRGARLYRVEAELVRYGVGGHTYDIGVEDYLGQDPDPLQHAEKDVLLDLRGRHAQRVAAFLSRRLEVPGDSRHGPPLPVRLDRHGFTVEITDPPRRWCRLDFPRPISGPTALADLLRPILAHDGASTW